MLNRLNAPQIGACKSEKGPKSADPDGGPSCEAKWFAGSPT